MALKPEACKTKKPSLFKGHIPVFRRTTTHSETTVLETLLADQQYCLMFSSCS